MKNLIKKLTDKLYKHLSTHSALKIAKYIGYFYASLKVFRIFGVFLRFFSYLLSGSFFAAFMVLYDFTSDINQVFDFLVSVKDRFFKIVSKVYSSMISNKDNISVDNIKTDHIETKKKSLLEQMIGSKSEADDITDTKPKSSLRNDNGYKHSVPDSNETPLYKDWRVWTAGAITIVGLGLLYYFYFDGFFPGSGSNSTNEAINSPFGPTIGPNNVQPPSIHVTSPVDSVASVSPDTTPKAPTIGLPTGSGGWLG